MPVKRLGELIKVIPDVLKKIGRIRLGILGDGPERARLKGLVQSLGISEHIEFLGHVDEVENYMNASRAVILVSQSEGLPAAAVEAMFCGLPVILTEVGNVQSVFAHEDNALLVHFSNKGELVNAIVRLLSDRVIYERLHRGAIKARDRYIRRWNKEEQRKVWESLLDFSIRNSEMKSFKRKS